MEVTEAPPAMMEVDSTILERVEKVCAQKSFSRWFFLKAKISLFFQGGWSQGNICKSHFQVEKVATNDEAQYQPPSELEPGQVTFIHNTLYKYCCQHQHQ